MRRIKKNDVLSFSIILGIIGFILRFIMGIFYFVALKIPDNKAKCYIDPSSIALLGNLRYSVDLVSLPFSQGLMAFIHLYNFIASLYNITANKQAE